MSIYADTSLFVSIYMLEKHSTVAQRWVASAPAIWLTPLHVAEWTHAIEQHVFRKEISPESALRLHEAFRQDRESGLWQELALPDSTYDRCNEVARRHCSRLGMRTLDTLHIAAALELKATDFWTFDERQVALAKAEGLRTRSIRSSTN